MKFNTVHYPHRTKPDTTACGLKEMKKNGFTASYEYADVECYRCKQTRVFFQAFGAYWDTDARKMRFFGLSEEQE